MARWPLSTPLGPCILPTTPLNKPLCRLVFLL